MNVTFTCSAGAPTDDAILHAEAILRLDWGRTGAWLNCELDVEAREAKAMLFCGEGKWRQVDTITFEPVPHLLKSEVAA